MNITLTHSLSFTFLLTVFVNDFDLKSSFYFEAKQEMCWSCFLFLWCGANDHTVHTITVVSVYLWLLLHIVIQDDQLTFRIDYWYVNIAHPTITWSSDPWWTLVLLHLWVFFNCVSAGMEKIWPTWCFTRVMSSAIQMVCSVIQKHVTTYISSFNKERYMSEIIKVNINVFLVVIAKLG